MGVSLLAVLPHHAAVVERVLPQEALGVVVAVDVDLGQSVVGGRLLAALVDTRLQPGQQQLQSVRGERTSGLSQTFCTRQTRFSMWGSEEVTDSSLDYCNH